MAVCISGGSKSAKSSDPRGTIFPKSSDSFGPKNEKFSFFTFLCVKKKIKTFRPIFFWQKVQFPAGPKGQKIWVSCRRPWEKKKWRLSLFFLGGGSGWGPAPLPEKMLSDGPWHTSVCFWSAPVQRGTVNAHSPWVALDGRRYIAKPIPCLTKPPPEQNVPYAHSTFPPGSIVFAANSAKASLFFYFMAVCISGGSKSAKSSDPRGTVFPKSSDSLGPKNEKFSFCV